MSTDTHAAVMAEANKILDELKEHIKEAVWTRTPVPAGEDPGWELWQGQIPNRLAFSVAGNPSQGIYRGAAVKGTTVVHMTDEVVKETFAARPQG